AVLVLGADPRAEEDLGLARSPLVGLDHREHVEPLREELHAPIDLAELLLAVDVLGVFGAIAFRRRVRHALHDPRALHHPQVIELLPEALVAVARDVVARLGAARSGPRSSHRASLIASVRVRNAAWAPSAARHTSRALRDPNGTRPCTR